MLRANFSIRAIFSKIILAVFGLLTVLSLIGCDEKALVCIGKEEEIQIGNHLTAGALQQFGGEANDIETQTLITRIGKTIADECDRKDMPWEFYYTNSDIPNAMALPGHVFVTKGMTELLKGPDGEVDVDMLAGVLSHEISHVVARHTARLAAERRLADLVEAGLDLLTKRDVTAAESAQFIRQFLLLGYNRNLEEEADRLGATYASRAGYARDGLLRAGERLLQRESRYPDTTAWYFRTHPEWRQRVRVLEQQLAVLDDEAVNKVVYEVNDKCSGWWGLVNLGVQYVRAKYILKSGAEIALVDSAGLGYPDTVIRSKGTQKTYYGITKGEKGLWQVATRVGPNGKPIYTEAVGYSPRTALEIKQKAATLLAKGRTAEAIKELHRAIELGSTDAETRLQLARAYQKAGNSAAAKSAYRSVLRGEWEGQSSEQAVSVLTSRSAGANQSTTKRKSSLAEGKEVRVNREMSQAEKEFEKFNREVENAMKTEEKGTNSPAKSGITFQWNGVNSVHYYLFRVDGEMIDGANCDPGKTVTHEVASGSYKIEIGEAIAPGYQPINITVSAGQITHVTPPVGQIAFQGRIVDGVPSEYLTLYKNRPNSLADSLRTWGCDPGKTCIFDVSPGSYVTEFYMLDGKYVDVVIQPGRVTHVIRPLR